MRLKKPDQVYRCMLYYFYRGETVATTKGFMWPVKRILYPLSVKSGLKNLEMTTTMSMISHVQREQRKRKHCLAQT